MRSREAAAEQIYPIEDYRKFYVREAGVKIRSSAYSQNKIPSDSSKTRLSEISLLSDGELLKTVRQLRGTEKKIEISMLLYLIEVERRGLDLSGGYNSLYAFCTKHLKYSDSVAGRRIRAARCMREFPAVYEYLSAGKVNVCNISLIAGIMTRENHRRLLDKISGRSTSYVRVLVSGHQPATFIRDSVIPVKVFEKEYVKANEKGFEDSNSLSAGIKGVLTGLENSEGGQKFTANVGGKNPCTLFGLSTESGSIGEGGEKTATGQLERGPLEGQVRIKTVQKFKLQFAVSPEFMTKFERIKELMSTSTPAGVKFEGAFEALMDEYIERHSPEARERRREARTAKVKVAKEVDPAISAAMTEPDSSTPGSAPPVKGPEQPLASPEPSRFIPQAVKDQVFKRYGGKCAYKGPDGQRCGSKWNVQVDHVKPFALGGSNEPENLQLLCRRHNQHKAVNDFGKKKMDGHLRKGPGID